MNKLVSKNPIQRFKQGKKIVKAYGGDSLRYNEDYDSLISSVQIPQKQKTTQKNITGIIPSGQDLTRFINYGQEAARKGLSLDKFKYLQKDSPYYRSFITGYNSIQQNQQQTNPVIRKNKIVNNYYQKNFIGRKAELAKQGKTVRDIQKMLGFTEGNGLDGIWGQNTENAYIAWLNAQNIPTESPEIVKPNEVYNASKDNQVYSFSGKTLPAPDYGYYSQSNYGVLNPKWLKTAGATNIEGFRNLVNNNSQLQQDLLNRYGEDWQQKLFEAAGVDPNKRHFGRKSRRLINTALQNVVNTLNDNYMDKVREYDSQYGLYKVGGQLVSRNPIKRFKQNKK